MRQDAANPHLVATGGKENDLKIWDLNTPEQPVFKAKNVTTVFMFICRAGESGAVVKITLSSSCDPLSVSARP